MLSYFALHIARGDVLYTHTNEPEVGRGAEEATVDDLWHADTAALYVPETAAHLAREHSGWLATWAPTNGLGRPLFQFGPSPTYVVPHALTCLTRDPFLHHTLMTACAVVGTALFGFLFLGALGIGAIGCFVGGLGLSLGPLFPTWDMIPLIQWGYCGALAALFVTERWIVTRSPWCLVGLTFAFHTVLLTGFLQHVQGLALIAAGWVVLRLVWLRDASVRERVALGLGVIGAAAFALLTVAPVYLDLYHEWARSTRAVTPQVFDPGARPSVLWPALIVALSAAEPGDVGISFGALYFVLVVVGAVFPRAGGPGAHDSGRQDSGHIGTWYWTATMVTFLAATESESVNWLLRGLGFGVSDWPPMFTAHLPAAVLAAHGVDTLLRNRTRRANLIVRGAIVTALAVGLIGVALNGPATVSPALLAATVLGAAGVLAVSFLRGSILRTTLMLSIALTSSLATAWEVVVWRPRASIATDSPLAAALRARTADGSRALWVGGFPPGRPWLEPNVDAVLGTKSLASYDHLPSRAYHAFVARLRAPEHRGPYVRQFRAAYTPEALDDTFFAFSGVRTLVSREALEALADCFYEGPEGVNVWAVREAGPLQALVAFDDEDRALRDLELDAETLRGADRAIDADRSSHDELTLTFAPTERARLLFLSQEFHADWIAHSTAGPLRTVTINGLFQGVVVPKGVGRVELRFRPYAPWMWVPQVLFAALGLAWSVGRLRAMRRRAAS